ncbi:hypothetical protein LBMAG33_0040 [Candidatus Levyibacteriota bacterium]|nr:RecX family transcriptional regulator [Candidatus Levybacteria bacterium]MSU25700.1 hypothetical protein [Candidatus Levybacteria bacterium]GDX61694.1 hypothetical protein LBMAG33_0040 [Candidatus Levybacteria bacterium]
MDIYEKFFANTLNFLSYRPRSEKEVRDHLFSKKSPTEFISRIIQECKDKGFINDEKFVVWWIDQRNAFRPRGSRLIKLELREKGISTEIINNVLSLIESSETQLATAKAIIQKRVYKMQNIPFKELKEKLSQYLERKGFDYEIIRQAIDDLDGEEV